MKKLFLLFFILLTGTAFAQNVPNGDFETWVDHTTWSNPQYWNTTDSVSVLQTGNPHSVVQETTLKHSGSSAMRLQTWNYSFFSEPGVATNGTFNLTTFSFGGGTADTVRHDQLTGWYGYAPAGGDSAIVMVFMTRWNGTSRDTVGKGLFVEKNSVTAYTSFSVPIIYSKTGNPDTALIIIASAGIGINSAHPGTVLYIDDLNFVGVNSNNDLPDNLISINAFPNPAVDFITIETKWNAAVRASVAILDMGGRLLSITPLADNRQRIDVSALSTGNYFYNLVNEKGAKLYSGQFSVNR